jgi:hypothetical protein
MTKLLERAFATVAALPEDVQDEAVHALALRRDRTAAS